MSSNLSLLAKSSNAGIFECPNCKETINVSDAKCRFCSAVIDPATAEAAAEKMSRINLACSDASFLRIAALSIFLFLGVQFIPFLFMAGFLGFYFLAFAVPFLSIRWWVRFYALRTDDPDFKKAKITVIIISALSLLPWLRVLLP